MKKIIIAAMIATGLTGCATTGLNPNQAMQQPFSRIVVGSISSVERFQKTEEPLSQIGTSLIGGLLGGVVGNQFGQGNGKKAMTVVGAGGGALMGNELAKSQRKIINMARLIISTSSGEMFDISIEDTGWKKGQRVQVVIENNKATVRAI